MSASIETTIKCKVCSRFNPGSTIRFDGGRSSKSFSTLAIKLGGQYTCARCGHIIGASSERTLPDSVAAILHTLVGSCAFSIVSFTDQNVGKPFVWLVHQADQNIRCHVRWVRDRRYAQDIKAELSKTYDPCKLGNLPPGPADAALRLLVQQGMRLQQLPGSFKAQVAADLYLIEPFYREPLIQDAGSKGEAFAPEEEEDVRHPIVVQVQVQWRGGSARQEAVPGSAEKTTGQNP